MNGGSLAFLHGLTKSAWKTWALTWLLGSQTLWKKVLLYVDRDLAPGRGHLSPDTRGPKNFCQPGIMTMVTRIPVLAILL